MQIVDLKCDVLIAGGGPAGVPCAIAAARSGAKAILCQDRSVLGGNASSEVRMHVLGANRCDNAPALLRESREGGIIEEIRLETCVRNPQRSAAMLDLVLYDLCRSEPNLTLLLDTSVTSVDMATPRMIRRATAIRQTTEDTFQISAKVFVDCTGDGRLGAEAGAGFMFGRESKEQFGEPLAEEVADRYTLGSTILFQAKKFDHPVPFIAPSFARKFTEEDLKLRPHASPGVDKGLEYGYWWAEWGGKLDSIKDSPRVRDELLAIVMGVWDHIKNGGDHGAENWALDWFGFLPAKRESRRFFGQHVLTQQDIQSSNKFDDAIAFGGWPIDMHPPGGVDAIDEHPGTNSEVPNLYDIPLRSCVSRDVDNLMFAGRNLSATHVAFASTRVMATCAAVGQGVGTAAAYAAEHQIVPAKLSESTSAISAIQQQLLRDDAYLIGVRREQKSNLAATASITASSEASEGKAVNIISGQTRSVHGPGGAPSDRSFPGLHRWMSEPAAGGPAWIEFKWPKAVPIHAVRLIFDTGLHRVLTLSHSNDFVKRMHWGDPQPETVRDYSVQAEIEGRLVALVNVTGNYQRLRVHQFPQAVLTSRMMITIQSTNGLDRVQICGVEIV